MCSIFERRKPHLSLGEVIGNLIDFQRSGEDQIFWIREIGVFVLDGDRAAENFLRKRFLEKTDNLERDKIFIIFEIFCELNHPLPETVNAMEKCIHLMKARRIAHQKQFGKSC